LEPFSKLRTLPFLGDPVHRQTTHDAQAWAESVCVRTPVRICEPLGNGKGFWFDSEVIRFGAVWVVSPEGSAITLSTEQHHSAQLLLPYQGLGSWKIGRDVFENPVGGINSVFTPSPLFLENDVTSGVALHFNPVVLIRAALRMAGPTELSLNAWRYLDNRKAALYRSNRWSVDAKPRFAYAQP
jgi:hypothetical protein